METQTEQPMPRRLMSRRLILKSLGAGILAAAAGAIGKLPGVKPRNAFANTYSGIYTLHPTQCAYNSNHTGGQVQYQQPSSPCTPNYSTLGWDRCWLGSISGGSNGSGYLHRTDSAWIGWGYQLHYAQYKCSNAEAWFPGDGPFDGWFWNYGGGNWHTCSDGLRFYYAYGTMWLENYWSHCRTYYSPATGYIAG
jgi:hypothetical protein